MFASRVEKRGHPRFVQLAERGTVPVEPATELGGQPNLQPAACLAIALLREELGEATQRRPQRSVLEVAERGWRREFGFAHNTFVFEKNGGRVNA